MINEIGYRISYCIILLLITLATLFCSDFGITVSPLPKQIQSTVMGSYYSIPAEPSQYPVDGPLYFRTVNTDIRNMANLLQRAYPNCAISVDKSRSLIIVN